MKKNKVLYLAKYAPCKNNQFIKNDYVKEYVDYHKELYDVLNEFCYVIPSNNFEDIIKFKNEIDFVFSVYNNNDFHGSEVLSSCLAAYYNIPYLGASPDIRAIAEDKHLAKMIASYANIKTPQWKIFSEIEHLNYVQLDFDPPYFIKPRYGKNSDDIDLDSIQFSKEGAKRKIRELLYKEIEVIVEEYIAGVYYTVPAWQIKNNEIHIFHSIREFSDKNMVTHNQKIYKEQGLVRSFNDNVKLNDILQEKVRSLYKLLQPLDFARFDFMIDEINEEIYFLELNICCSLSSRSTFALAAKREGYTYNEFIKTILYSSLSRQK